MLCRFESCIPLANVRPSRIGSRYHHTPACPVSRPGIGRHAGQPDFPQSRRRLLSPDCMRSYSNLSSGVRHEVATRTQDRRHQGRTYPAHVTGAEHGKPDSSPNLPEQWKAAGNSQGKLLAERVEDGGKSEGRLVMSRTGIQVCSVR